MKDLSPDAQSIVDGARGSDGPTDADFDRNRRATLARLGLGLGALSAAASTASAAGAATTVNAAATAAGLGGAGGAAGLGAAGWSGGSLLAVKAIAGVAVVCAAGLGTARWHAASVVAPGASASAAAAVATPAPALPAPEVRGPQLEVQPAVAPSPPGDRSVAPPRRAKTSRPVLDATSLSDETALLRRANEALAVAEPERALTLLDEYAARFPHGVLEEEHAAARAIALCEAHRASEGRAAATGFLQAHPRSPLAVRVRLACRD